jgi:hypothetical protein
MPYRVRSPDGELRFQHFVDIANAYRQGLVGPDDEIIDEGKETGVKASEHPILRGSGPKPERGSNRQGLLVACAAGLAFLAFYFWNHTSWPLGVRLAAVLADGVALALVLSRIVQESARRKR